jgi:hypothetical protein
MAQRVSGYVRQANDAYETTSWVTEALVPHIRKLALHVWEPAAGSGMMVEALRNAGFRVTATDINAGADFLKCGVLPNDAIQAICTNPPFSDAQAFIEHALTLTRPVGGVVAMLLRTDFDRAKTRRHLSPTVARSQKRSSSRNGSCSSIDLPRRRVSITLGGSGTINIAASQRLDTPPDVT